MPLGLAWWGLGNVGELTVSQLTKDLERRLSGKDPEHKEWALDPSAYTVEGVANKARDFFFGEHYSGYR